MSRTGGIDMRTIVLGIASCLVIGAASPLWATTGTCTISMARAVNSLHLPFNVPAANGIALGVEFDTSGSFTLSGDAWFNQFGADGASFPTGFGPNGFLIMHSGGVVGTIDSKGNIVVPNFASAFATDFCPPRSPDYPISPALTTTTQFRVVSGAVDTTEGTPMDPSGVVTIEGEDLIPAACGAGAAILTGFAITCQLSPVPDLTRLPQGPTLDKPGGTGKIGPALPDQPPACDAPPQCPPIPGDTLKLKARLSPGLATLDFTQDVYLRLAASDTAFVLVKVPAGKFQPKGSGYAFVDLPPNKKGVDKDGTSLVVYHGQKSNAAVSSTIAGTIKLVKHKGTFTLSASLLGLDLTGLSGAGTLLVQVGPYTFSTDVALSAKGKAVHIARPASSR